MSKRIYIGGFGNGRRAANRVAEALHPYFGPVDSVFTFSQAMRYPDAVRRTSDGGYAVTHSAGMLALRGATPESVFAFNPPLPTTPGRLLAKTGHKTGHMHTPGKGISGVGDIGRVTELLQDPT